MSILGIVGFIGVGLALGLLGGGGSILAVPVLVHLFDLPISTAVPMALPVVGITAGVGAWTRWRRRELRLRTVATFAGVAMVAAFLSARAGAGIGDRVRTVLLAVTMLAAAIVMLLRSRRSGASATPPLAGVQRRSRAVVLIPASIVVGTLTGIVGVGGGFLIVPALTGVLAYPMPVATATSLAVIALNCFAAGAGYLGKVSFDPVVLAVVTVAALIGMAVGTRLARRTEQQTLARVFAVMLVVVAALMLWKGG